MIRRKPLSRQEALERMEALCSRSEQASSEVRHKLWRLGMSAADTDAILKELKRNRFVDDRRFAVALVNDKWEYSRWGRIKIRAKLRSLAIDPDAIDEALESIDEKNYRCGFVALLLAKARASAILSDTYENRARLMRFAASRGFEAAMAIEIINSPKLWERLQRDSGE